MNGVSDIGLADRNYDTHLHEAVSGVPIPEVRHSKGLTTRDFLCNLFLPDLHGKEGNRALHDSVWIGFILLCIERRVIDFVESCFLWQLIEDVAKGGAS